ncbi:MAG TPA: methylenetetrahydrofolate reductase [NAD(P)H] [Candidatus Omnitrophota bacterium]|nr:methylenetetrahydrofolate reductase [NAD(P)H] [Candidatus Omnitrophota bacterium]
MKVSELLKKEKPTLSFEFFPPKNADQEAQMFSALSQLAGFKPDFVSVTYGAMGSNRENAFFWVSEIKKKFGIEPVAHLTCVASSKNEIARYLEDLKTKRVENILALRGDPPQGIKDFVPPADGFRFAKELIAFIREKQPQMCVGAAGFPEGHIMVPDPATNIAYLKQKIDAGAEYVISQLFFDDRLFFDFTECCRKAGINVPIIPGLMPITSYKQIKKMTETCGATIPKGLLAELEKHQDEAKAILQIGAEQTLRQAEELLKNKVKGLHFFVMNQAEPVAGILGKLQIRN